MLMLPADCKVTSLPRFPVSRSCFCSTEANNILFLIRRVGRDTWIGLFRRDDGLQIRSLTLTIAGLFFMFKYMSFKGILDAKRSHLSSISLP